MLTKLSQWVSIRFCPLIHRFSLESRDLKCYVKPRRSSLFDVSFKTLDYVIISHQALLFKTTKHWDGFVSHCNIRTTTIFKCTSKSCGAGTVWWKRWEVSCLKETCTLTWTICTVMYFYSTASTIYLLHSSCHICCTLAWPENGRQMTGDVVWPQVSFIYLFFISII